MRETVKAWRRGLWVAGLIGSAPGAAGCASQKDPVAEPCPRAGAAFRLEVTAADEVVPEDVSIVVRYQGSQQEGFDLSVLGQHNEDVCCRISPTSLRTLPSVACSGPGASGDGGAVRAVHCELWTSGIAEVTVTGGDYPSIVETLQAVAREDDCGLETTPVRLVLTHRDAGR